MEVEARAEMVVVIGDLVGVEVRVKAVSVVVGHRWW